MTFDRFIPSANFATLERITVAGAEMFHDGRRPYLDMGINPDGTPVPMTVDELHAEIDKSADIASAWWAERVRDAQGVGDNGATGGPGREAHLPSMLAMGLAQQARREANIRPADVDSFQTALREQLVATMRGAPYNAGFPPCHHRDIDPWCRPIVSVRLEVDYHPYGLLKTALAASSIPANLADWAVLPLKTHMEVSARRIELRAGYAAGSVQLRCAWGEDDATLNDADRRRWWSLEHHRNAHMNAYMIERYGVKYPKWDVMSEEDQSLTQEMACAAIFGPIRDVVEDPYPDDKETAT